MVARKEKNNFKNNDTATVADVRLSEKGSCKRV